VVTKNLRRLREEKLLTQGQLAELLGVPYQRIGEWERNERTPRLSTQGKLAEVLGVTPVELRAALDARPEGKELAAA
jgi:transcriptional regulator with XRE-family HTH domain